MISSFLMQLNPIQRHKDEMHGSYSDPEAVDS